MNPPTVRVGDPFDQLLARLAPSREEAGQTYERLRTRLVRLFEGRRVLDPGSALRQAQTALRRDPRWRRPYCWAGFVLQGDWR